MAEQSNSPAAVSYLELIEQRREVEAARLVRRERERGVSLRSIYVDIFAVALGEAAGRRSRGELTEAQELFIGHATERIMTVFEPELLRTNAPHGPALCASFGSVRPGLQIRIAGALLAIDGYDVCYVGPESTLEAFELVVDQNDPRVCVLFANEPAAAESLAHAIRYVREKSGGHALVIAGGPGIDTRSLTWKRDAADICVRNAFEAVSAVAGRRYQLQGCEV
jgi:methanogenic corrinoid protein MtbC1